MSRQGSQVPGRSHALGAKHRLDWAGPWTPGMSASEPRGPHLLFVLRLQLRLLRHGLCLEAQCLAQGRRWMLGSQAGSPVPNTHHPPRTESSSPPGARPKPQTVYQQFGGPWPQTGWGGQEGQMSSGTDQGKSGKVPTSSRPAHPTLLPGKSHLQPQPRIHEGCLLPQGHGDPQPRGTGLRALSCCPQP